MGSAQSVKDWKRPEPWPATPDPRPATPDIDLASDVLEEEDEEVIDFTFVG